MVCPGTNGGKNWPAGAYSPRTNSMYMPMQNMCMNATVQTGERDPSLVYGFKSEYIPAPGADKIGVVWAISAETGKTVCKHEQRVGVMSLVATGGGLVFGGDVAATSGRSTTRRAKCCGRRTSVRRSAATRSASPSTASSTWP